MPLPAGTRGTAICRRLTSRHVKEISNIGGPRLNLAAKWSLGRPGRQPRNHMPQYSTIDGDISDYFDALVDMTKEFQTKELRQYLINDGHSETEADAAIRSWQASRFKQLDPQWTAFTLTEEGMKAVEDLQNRV